MFAHFFLVAQKHHRTSTMFAAPQEAIRTLNAHALPIVPINHSGLVSFNINAISAVPVVVPPPSAACAGSQVTKKLVSANAAVFDLSSSTLTRFCVWIPALTLPPHLGQS